MTTPGRGRGYTGRHHLREPRPGDEHSEDLDAVRTLAELSPRSTAHEQKKLLKEITLITKKINTKETVTSPIADTTREKDTKDMEREKEDRPADGKEGKQIEEDTAIKELLHIDEQYAPLLNLLEQFSPGEDGIQFNRKLRHFETTVTNMCPDEPRLQHAFSSFRAAALRHASSARKLAAVGASFTRQQRQQLLRGALLNVVMQGTFSKLDVLERSNPLFLINAANLMGDYFAEARLCNGNKVHILANPLLQYMRALLASDDIRAHRSLATQLMQNGRELLSVLSQELDELSISIRLRLLTPPPVSIIWLLLSADLCLNKFLPLPNTLQQFYAAHLELTSEENYSEVSYGSWKNSPEKDGYKSDSDGSLIEKVQNVSQLSLNDDDKPKLRPILGAGAGLLRQEQALNVSQDTFDNWTTKNTLSKRYDLNSWRQAEEDVEETEPVFNPTVLPPNLQQFPVTVPDYPPPAPRFNYPENFPNYLQQGDGTYIQNQFTPTPVQSQGDFVPQYTERQPPLPERVNNEIQKNSRRPIENWRKEKIDVEDPNKRQKSWTRQKSNDNLNEENNEEFKERSVSRNREIRPRLNRRNSDVPDSSEAKTPPRRHVSDVPRNHKYWDHDDRCDKDYNS